MSVQFTTLYLLFGTSKAFQGVQLLRLLFWFESEVLNFRFIQSNKSALVYNEMEQTTFYSKQRLGTYVQLNFFNGLSFLVSNSTRLLFHKISSEISTASAISGTYNTIINHPESYCVPFRFFTVLQVDHLQKMYDQVQTLPPIS